MIYFDNTQDEQRVSIPRSIASETAPTGPYRPGDGISINNNTISVTGRQETLVSGQNIKTINGESLLGEGNIVISGGTGGTSYSAGTNIDITNNTISVTGITSYTGITSGDVVTALGFEPASENDMSNKQDTLVSGENIKTINGQSILGEGNIVISGGTGDYSAGTNIDITNDTISVTGITSFTGITKNDVTTALGFTPVSSTTITEIWSGTQAEYANIYPKLSTTLYLVHE